MPLAFESLTHGTVAFGFFNIETDLLLLDRLFFFSTDFCCGVERALDKDETASMEGYLINDGDAIGDLHGAIAGTRFEGFIGAVYRLFPFPAAPEAFRQNPAGDRIRPQVEKILSVHATAIPIPLRFIGDERVFEIKELRFSWDGFRGLMDYLFRGGYPRWKGDAPPSHVMRLRRKLDHFLT